MMTYYVIKADGQLPGLSLYWSGKVWCGKAKKYRSMSAIEKEKAINSGSKEFNKYTPIVEKI